MAHYHGHGSQPVIERFGTYLEWHAMFCGLGEWLETESLAVPDYPSDALEHWISRWKPTEAPTWLADRRELRPLGAEFAVDICGEDKYWIRRIPKKEYLGAVCGDRAFSPEVLTIFGNWTTNAKTRVVETETSSALVEPSSATALLRALHGDKKRFWLPTEREESDDEHSLGTSPFLLCGWLVRANRDTQYDKDDPFRADVSELCIIPSSDLIRKYGLTKEGTPTSRWVREKSQTGFHYEAWSEWDPRSYGRRSHGRPVGSNGYRLVIDKGALESILEGEGLDLLVEVQIRRRLESEHGEATGWDDKTKNRTARKIFIFRRGGEIEDQAGRVGAWR